MTWSSNKIVNMEKVLLRENFTYKILPSTPLPHSLGNCTEDDLLLSSYFPDYVDLSTLCDFLVKTKVVSPRE